MVVTQDIRIKFLQICGHSILKDTYFAKYYTVVMERIEKRNFHILFHAHPKCGRVKWEEIFGNAYFKGSKSTNCRTVFKDRLDKSEANILLGHPQGRWINDAHSILKDTHSSKRHIMLHYCLGTTGKSWNVDIVYEYRSEFVRENKWGTHWKFVLYGYKNY